MTGLMRDTDLMKRLNIPQRTFYRLKTRGALDHFKTTRPLGTRIYSSELVDRFLAGGSTVQLGRRSA